MISKIDQYFLTIIKTGSLSKAAEVLYISQPSLTKQIKCLEAQLGTPLFDHGTKPLRLNAAGEVYREYLAEAVRKEEQLLRELQEANDRKRGTLSIGTPPYLGHFFLPRLLSAFFNVYPNVFVKCAEGTGTALQSAVAGGQMDIAFAHIPVTENNVASRCLSNERIFIVAPQSQHTGPAPISISGVRFATLDPAMLAEWQFCMPLKEQMLGKTARRIFSSRNILPKVLLQCGNPSTAMTIVSRLGNCACFVPGYVVSYIPAESSQGLVFYYLDSPEFQWEFSVLYRKNTVLSIFAQEMIHIAREIKWISDVSSNHFKGRQ